MPNDAVLITEQNTDISRADREVTIFMPNSIDANTLEFSVVPGSTEDTWVDTTGKHVVTKVGQPTVLAGQFGIITDKDNCLSLDFAEQDLATDSYTILAIGRHRQDGVYSTANLLGAYGGTTASSDPNVGIHGFSVGVQNTGSNTRIISQYSQRNGANYNSGLLYSNQQGVNDSGRIRMVVQRLNMTAGTFGVFDFGGYDGVATPTPVNATFSGGNTLTGRRKGKTNIHLGSFNGNTSTDQSQFIAGLMFNVALTDAQIKDLVNSIKNQFYRSVSGGFTGVSVVSGYSPIDLFTPVIA